MPNSKFNFQLDIIQATYRLCQGGTIKGGLCLLFPDSFQMNKEAKVISGGQAQKFPPSV
jgi:hypothetical protein